jgi:hypothetical protein
MLKFLWQRSLRFLIGALLLILFIAGIFPGTGGEGAQRESQNLSEKTDWWNFATAGLYGSWPNFFGSWEFSLTVVQVLIYLLGIYLISRELSLKQNRFFFIIISTTGALFVIQLWRDATLFSLLTLSLGLLASLKKLQTPKECLRLFFALSICLTGFLFKPIFAPLGILIIMVFLSLSLPTKRKMASFTLAALLISFIPFFFDKQLSSHFQLTKSYPEQQVMIYDLSKMYCWGYSQEAISQSKDALKPLLRNEDGYEKVCASLSPTGWDSLRVINPEVRSSPALRVVTAGEEEIRDDLLLNWIKVALTNPFDWLMVKSSDLTQVLFMANAFFMPGIFAQSSSSIILNSGDFLIKVFLFPVLMLDKIRIFTLGVTLLFGLFMIYFNRASANFSLPRERALFRFLTINMMITLVATLAFIANNGRYVLPFILLSYFYLLLAVERSGITLFSRYRHQL